MPLNRIWVHFFAETFVLCLIFINLTSVRRTGWKLWWQVLCHLAHCNIWLPIKLMLSSFTDHHSQNDWSFGCGTVFKGVAFQIHECLFWESNSFWNYHFSILIYQKEDIFLCGLWQSYKYIALK